MVVFAAALKQLRRMSRPDRERISRAIERLPEGDVRPLHGEEDVWRLRVGDWRVRYERHDNERRIDVLDVKPRGSAYKP